MAQSYVPHGAYVTCTEAKSPAPMQLYYNRAEVSVINFENEKAPLLTVADKKLSNQFTCNINSKFWGGLKMLCAVVAIGALAIATVATGGLILVIAAAAIVGMGVATYKEVAHDCDVTLESKWLGFHDSVNFNGHAALLKNSNMLCNKGGALNIMLDKNSAASAAQKISALNQEEYQAHLNSQTLQTALMVISSKGDPKALAVAFPLTVYNYVDGEAGKQATRKSNMEKIINKQKTQQEGFWDKMIGGAPTSARDAVLGAATDADVYQHGIVPSALVLKEMGTYTISASMRGTPGAFRRVNYALMLTMGRDAFKKVGRSLGEGFAWGMAGAAVDAGYDVYEDQLHEEAYLEAFNARDTEEKSLTIIAGDKK